MEVLYLILQSLPLVPLAHFSFSPYWGSIDLNFCEDIFFSLSLAIHYIFLGFS